MDNEISRVAAVMVPVGYPGQGSSRERLSRLDREFAPLLGVRAMFIRQQGTGHFLSPQGGDTLLHPTHSPLAGQPRYDWLDRGDGVLYGTIKPD
ncbi:hypothetical protein EP7_005233 [Isosphaeraceae bacterium EP7]